MSVAIHSRCIRGIAIYIHRQRRSVRQKTGKIAANFSGRWNQRELWQSLGDAQTLVIHEEKCAIFDDRAAKGGAELILTIRLPAGVECVPTVEHIVSEEFVNVAVEAIRSGLDHGIENRAVPAAEFR